VFIQMRVRKFPYLDIEPDGKWVFSNTISVKLTEAPTPPADLVGLQGFDVCIPEPSTTALVLLGAAALLLRFGAPKLLRGQGGGH